MTTFLAGCMNCPNCEQHNTIKVSPTRLRNRLNPDNMLVPHLVDHWLCDNCGCRFEYSRPFRKYAGRGGMNRE